MLERMKIFLWRLFACPWGFHKDKNAYGVKGSFCMYCGKQTDPNPFHEYVVTLKDGTEFKVKAANKIHARNLVVYAGDKRVDGHSGQPAGIPKVHPNNIASIESPADARP